MAAHKSVAPYYAVAVTWLVYACFFPLYAPSHYALMAVVSVVIFALISLLCRNTAQAKVQTDAPKAEEKPS